MRFQGASRSSNRQSSIREVRSGTSVRFHRNNNRSPLQNALDVVLYNNVAHHLQSQLSYRTAQEERQSIIEQSQLWPNLADRTGLRSGTTVNRRTCSGFPVRSRSTCLRSRSGLGIPGHGPPGSDREPVIRLCLLQIH